MSKPNFHEFDTDEPVAADLRFVVLGICLIASVLFSITYFIDVQAQKGFINLPKWIYIGNIDDARVMLNSLLQSVSTVLGLVFSVVLLVLSMASTQFGPRLLRRFILDYNGQSTIGLFTATFLFILFTLIVARVENGHELVPHVTTFTAIFLVIISFGALINFSQNIRKGIQTGNVIARVTKDTSWAIADYIALRKERAKDDACVTSAENPIWLRKRCIEEGYPIFASNAGYLQAINYKAIIESATAADAVIALKVHPGNFIIKGTVLAHLIPAEKGPLLIKNINNALRVGSNRTLSQDPEFAFTQIVEIGIRALGQAINDTYTGIACIDWLSNNVLSLVELPETGESWRDKMGHTRLIEVPVKFPRIVAAAFDMIRESGASNPAILIRLLQNFARMGPHLKTSDQRTSLMRQVTAIRELTELQSLTQTDLNDIIDFYNKACEALKG